MADWVKKWRKFVEKYYYEELLNRVKKGEKSLVVNYSKIAKSDLELAEELLKNPEEIIKYGELCFDEFDLDTEEPIKIRIRNIPKGQNLMINEIRSKHLGELISTVGLIRQTSDVRPRISVAQFECPSCGQIIPVEQRENKLMPPVRCNGCGRKGRFKLNDRTLVDVQRIVMEETPESLMGGEQPKKIPVFLSEDLLNPKLERRRYPGNKVEIIGIVKEVPIRVKSGARSTTYDLIIDANYVDTVQEEFEEIKISKEDEKEIKKLAKSKEVYSKFVNSIAPSIYGYEDIKEAIVLQLFGGVKKKRADGSSTRGDIHIFLVGDPGAGKSEILRSVTELAPKARYIAGKGASGAGLCVAPNSLVLSNPGGMRSIQEIVDEKLIDKEEFRPGVWKQENVKDLKIQTFSDDLKLMSMNSNKIWKLRAPSKVFEIVLTGGKKIELTGNTKLFSIKEGKTFWKKALEVNNGDYVATPRKLISGNRDKVYIVDLIESNPVVHNIKGLVSRTKPLLLEKYGELRVAAKELGFSENNLYPHWVNDSARGNIKINSLKRLCDSVNVNWKEEVREVSLYNGKNHKIPTYLSKDLLYVSGLIAGDGDLRKSGSTYSVRFSNSNLELHSVFENVIKEQFKLNCDVQKGNRIRPQSTRFNSKILAEVLFSLGIPISPKSNKLFMSENLLKLSDDLLSEYIAGLYDSDGSVCLRNSKGSDSIEFYTCSEKLARQMQLVLLRFGIYSRLRSRKPTEGKIKSKYARWILTIRGSKHISKFSKYISLRHPKKRKNLLKIVDKNLKSNTNLDVIPGVSEIVKEILQKKGISLKSVGWRKNMSRSYLKKKLSELNIPELSGVKKLVQSDIFWEKVVSVKEKDSSYDYVYDLTVNKSHSFIVDGVLVHNTATVVKDEFISGWTLEAGALVLANNGLVGIDEIDKMGKEDRSAMHEALEQQVISISKATIQATLKSQTSVLGAANPKYGRFDPYSPIPTQIELPPTLINRFDLIFPIRDIPKVDIDKKIASHVLDLHRNPMSKEPELGITLFRKYIAHAKKTCKPKLGGAALNKIKNFYVDLRSAAASDAGEVTSVPISARQLEALIRLSEASAKVRLSNKVRKEDAERAIKLLKSCMKAVAVDAETGRFDIDKIAVGITSSQRGRISTIRKILEELTEKLGKTVPISDVLDRADEEGIDKTKTEEILEELKKKGDIFEPKSGVIQKVG